MPPTLNDLLERGYFPKELPPVFTTTGFAAYIATNVGFKAKRSISQCASHTLARPGGQRRRLQVPNPFGYLALCSTITNGWSIIEQHYKKSKLSLSTPVVDTARFRSVRAKTDLDSLLLERASKRKKGRFIVHADIARFYGSIYSHSLPWSLHGKSIAKAKKHDFSLLGNALDRDLRNLQDGQTLGIPIGPDASLILAEIVATVIDQKLTAARIDGHRFIDDFELVFRARADADSAVVQLEQALAELELALNARKTLVSALPVELDRAWVADLRNFTVGASPSRADTIRYFDLAFRLKEQFPFEPVLSYAIGRIRSKTPKDWKLVQDLLGQSVLAEPGVIEQVCRLLYEQRSRGLRARDLDQTIRSVIEIHAPLMHGSEVVWAVWMSLLFSRRIAADVAELLAAHEDPFVLLLALLAQAKGYISAHVPFTAAQARVAAPASLASSDWILAYEAAHQGWLGISSPKSYFAADPDFAGLHGAGVSFLDQSLSIASRRATLKASEEEARRYG